nr:Uncharacterised protein [Raoultella sp. NCTC 9187]
MLFKHLGGDLPVDFGAGELLQQLRALFGFGVKKGGELALGEEHRAGKAAVIEAGERGGHLQLVFDFVGKNLPIVAAGQLDAGRLQVAVGLVARAVLAPEGAVGGAFDLKLNFSQAFGGIAGHQIVLRLRHAAQARRFVVQREADSVQQRRFPGPRRPDDREQPVAGEGFGGEINFPLAFQRVKVFQTQAQNFHKCSSPFRLCSVSLNSCSRRCCCGSSRFSSAQATSKNLLNPQFAEGFPPLAGQNALALGAAAAHQQHFHRQRFAAGLDLALNIVQIFIAGDFNIQPGGGQFRAVLPLVKLFADAGEIAL